MPGYSASECIRWNIPKILSCASFGIPIPLSSMQMEVASGFSIAEGSMLTRTRGLTPSATNFTAFPRRLPKHCVRSDSLPRTCKSVNSTVRCQRFAGLKYVDPNHAAQQFAEVYGAERQTLADNSVVVESVGDQAVESFG